MEEVGMSRQLTRRSLLERCATFGALYIAVPTSLSKIAEAWDSAGKKLQPTPSCELGPFYRRSAPNMANLRTDKDTGMPMAVSGVVYSVSGEALPEAKVEVWQTDHFGHYDIEGYRFRSTVQSDRKGLYSYESVVPGHYPQRVCQHVHYLVTAPGHKPLVTQLYFATDPVFDGDPQKNFSRDPLITSVELVRPVTIKGDPKEMIAAVNFDLVMEKR
jgi:protocatechuate 3,4-dioxygenase beta subunit